MAGRSVRNLAGICLGRNLVRIGEGLVLTSAADETKNHQPLEFPVPEALAPMINRYLAVHRPRTPGSGNQDGLWASAKGGPLVPEAVYDRICRRTSAAFGHTINPHLFRDFAATTVAIDDPAHIGEIGIGAWSSRPTPRPGYRSQSFAMPPDADIPCLRDRSIGQRLAPFSKTVDQMQDTRSTRAVPPESFKRAFASVQTETAQPLWAEP